MSDHESFLCPLTNPLRRRLARRLRKQARRSWIDPYAAHVAVDELALEHAMRSHRRGSRRRNCGRNPSRKKNPRARKHRRWFGKLSRTHQRSVIRLGLGRMNPGLRHYSPKGDLLWSGSPRRPTASAAYLVRKRIEQLRRRRNCMRNPKRDGTPTRGEVRRVKYLEYLKKVAASGEEARYAMQQLTGEMTKAGAGIFEPLGKRAVKRAVKAHTADWEAQRSSPAEREAEEAAPVVAPAEEPYEIRFINGRLHDIDVLVADYNEQLKELSQDEQLNEAEIELVHEEIAKLARSKKNLRAKLQEVMPAATNPRGRGRGRRRLRVSPARARRMLRAAQVAQRALRRAIRAARSLTR